MHDVPEVTLAAAALARGGSALLAAMPADDLAFLARHARREDFVRGDVLAEADAPAEAAYFIESGVASVVKPQPGERRTEICLLGPADMVGAPLLLADGRWPYQTFVQSERLSAVRVHAAAARRLFADSGEARALLLGAIHAQIVQIAEGLVSAVWQRIPARLARWLLMFRDRLGSDTIGVTHQFMALMIGAQRAKVTAALHELEGAGAVAGSRGVVRIRDAALLERFADGTYGRAEEEAARLAAQRPGAVRVFGLPL